MNIQNLSASATSAPVSNILAVPNRDNSLADCIAAAYAGEKYGKSKLLDAIRGGMDIAALRVETLASALCIARSGKESGYILDGKTLNIRKGKGKTLANDLAMATTASAFSPPNSGETLSGWYGRVTKPAAAAAAAVLNQDNEAAAAAVLNQDNEAAAAADSKAIAIALKPFETAKIDHTENRLTSQSGTAAAAEKDDIKAFLELADSSLDDNELAEVIAGLISLQNRRNDIRLAS